MTTEEIIADLRQNGLTSASIYTRMERAANRLEELQEAFSETVKQRDKAMREAAHWKSIAEHRQLVARQDPSRLEIAAMLLAAMCGSQYTWTNAEGLALRKADVLIALEKEVQE